MPKTCTVCRHPERAAIDGQLVDGQPVRRVARQFATSKDCLQRHRAHLPAALLQAKAATAELDADNLLGHVRALWRRVDSIITEADEAGDARLALAGIHEARAVLELLGKLVAETALGKPTKIIIEHVDMADRPAA